MRHELIESDPAKVNGQPCVVGTRLTVRRVLALLASYPDRNELFREFPELDEARVQAVLRYAQTQLPDRVTEVTESR
jgi:uncharacterized protein (DUF433 family)